MPPEVTDLPSLQDSGAAFRIPVGGSHGSSLHDQKVGLNAPAEHFCAFTDGEYPCSH